MPVATAVMVVAAVVTDIAMIVAMAAEMISFVKQASGFKLTI